MKTPFQAAPTERRRFLAGLATAATLSSRSGFAQPSQPPSGPSLLDGTDFALDVAPLSVNLTGRSRVATAVNGQIPAPILRWREGDTVRLAVTNRLATTTSIHWHGIRTPSNMDGVPGLSFPGIAPGETFVYRFQVPQSGTYWYHAHSAFQEQTGIYGALIVDPAEGYPQPFDRDYVVLLSDWSDEAPERILSNLQLRADYYNDNQRTVGDLLADIRRVGLASTVRDRLAWGDMRMTPTDILDVTAATYTYLLNGHPPQANWTALFRPGERIRLRFINASAMTIFDVRIPGLP
ncbi:MAG: multicopper oxidase domain-containing protein, partial [Acetobacteraceae bacterium]